MLSCRFFLTGEGLCRGFELIGHAEGGNRGENLVCAGASTLAQTCISSLHILLERHPVVEKGDSGYLRCMLTEDPEPMSDLLFRSMAVGLKYLEKAGENPGITIEYDSGGKINGS